MQSSQPHRLQISRTGNHAASGAQTPSLLKYAQTGKPASATAVLSKVLAPAVLSLGLWSKVWLGGAFAGLLCLVALILLVLAPKFPGMNIVRFNWARQVGFGEKIWLNRMVIPVPQGLNYRLTTLYMVFWSGVLVALWGGLATLPLLSATGLAVAYSAQFACFVKLIHLYRVMKDKYPLYRFWSKAAVNDNSAAATHPTHTNKKSA
ncbi:DUF6653 family protein [Roseibium sp. Sym1]|uniref:DUF6653 family protein n=1 Tax=Roseibium sp. Sym1 TaxID=3016006 RepID=UPI0022B47C11|nr:DUF6653 family protein [Roseibium sp. Sym1]